MKYKLFVTWSCIALIFFSCENVDNESLIYKSNSYTDALKLNRSNIINISKKLNFDSKIVFSIIESELSLNYNVFDKYDNLRAKLGEDPSIGLCQIKISTAVWIEKNFSEEYSSLEISSARNVLIDKLNDDSINIYYCVVYLDVIRNKYYSLYQEFPSVQVLASLYSKGIDKKQKCDYNYINNVGEKALALYNIKSSQEPF